MKETVELREKVAELEHEQWITWASSIISTEAISKDRIQRWQHLMIPYNQLTEEQKVQDRRWADKVISIFLDPDCPKCKMYQALKDIIESLNLVASTATRQVDTLVSQGLIKREIADDYRKIDKSSNFIRWD